VRGGRGHCRVHSVSSQLAYVTDVFQILKHFTLDIFVLHLSRNFYELKPRFKLKFRVFWDVCRVVTLKLTDVSEVRTASIIRPMNGLNDSKLHTRPRENLKSHKN
jgi:hypothetical protein